LRPLLIDRDDGNYRRSMKNTLPSVTEAEESGDPPSGADISLPDVFSKPVFSFMIIQAARLHEITTSVFKSAGCSTAEAERIAKHLVEANLVGHDSHGVIRTSSYLRWMKAGQVLADRQLQIMFENEAIAVVDGQFGSGQTVGEQAMELGIAKAARHGVAVIALRNAGHLGQIGVWPLMASQAGKLSVYSRAP